MARGLAGALVLSRPTLAAHVAARRHVVRGRTVVVLHDTARGRTAAVGSREWTVLRCADGTRDAAGIALAAGARGCATTTERVQALLADLAAAGMLEEGLAVAPVAAESPPGGRPLLRLAGFRLRCDGSGSCCRIYPTTELTPIEARRAVALVPELGDSGGGPAGLFTPAAGSTAAPWRACAVAMVEGRCAFLTKTNRCSLQVCGGAAAKPLGCRLYPVALCDDGESVRVSARPECACVLASARRGGGAGEPLLPASWRCAADLPPAVVVERLAEPVAVTADSAMPRAAFRAWCVEVRALLPEVGTSLDAARLCWVLGEQLASARGQVDARAAALAVRSAAEQTRRTMDRWPAAALGRALAAPAAVLLRQEAEGDWRVAGDLARAVPRAIGRALRLVIADGGTAAADAEAERSYLELTAHGHLWAAAGEPPLVEALQRRALRLLLSRRLRDGAEGLLAGDEALAEPLALVEAAATALGRF